MESVFTKFKTNLEPIQGNFLLAVSGGVDSMVLCDLFLKNNLDFSVAHCNFQLRGRESEADEEFVKQYCIQNQIKYFCKKFDVHAYKSSGNYSTQMAARELRYAWFRELMLENDFDFLVTAHHLNDALETFFINLSRGTGIKGLTGIPLHQNQVIRPLFNVSKESILEYAETRSIHWREDASNASDDYVRNKIRNRIVPVLKEIHPEFLQNFQQTIQFLNEEKDLIQNHIEKLREKLFILRDGNYTISIEKLNQLQPLSSSLFHLFSKFGFNHPAEIIKLINATEGNEISSEAYRLIKNRGEFILSKKKAIETSAEFMVEEGKLIQKPLNLKFLKSAERDISATETLDYEQIVFPLRLRKPKTGEVFYPFGMKGSKKLSKFLKDEKLSKLEKENIWLLVDGKDRILYVTGIRIDDRFKITEHTHKFLNIYLC